MPHIGPPVISLQHEGAMLNEGLLAGILGVQKLGHAESVCAGQKEGTSIVHKLASCRGIQHLQLVSRARIHLPCPPVLARQPHSRHGASSHPQASWICCEVVGGSLDVIELAPPPTHFSMARIWMSASFGTSA